MSQEKVNKYKEEKANRKQIMKRERRNRTIGRIVGAVICLAVVCWLGYSVYDSVNKKSAASQTEANLEAMQNYLGNLSAPASDEGGESKEED